MSDVLDNPYFQPSKGGNPASVPDQSQEPIPKMIRTPETGDRVFLVRDHYYHWITTPEVLKTLGLNWGDIKSVAYSVLRVLDKGENIVMENVEKFKETKEEVEKEVELKTYE